MFVPQFENRQPLSLPLKFRELLQTRRCFASRLSKYTPFNSSLTLTAVAKVRLPHLAAHRHSFQQLIAFDKLAVVRPSQNTLSDRSDKKKNAFRFLVLISKGQTTFADGFLLLLYFLFYLIFYVQEIEKN